MVKEIRQIENLLRILTCQVTLLARVKVREYTLVREMCCQSYARGDKLFDAPYMVVKLNGTRLAAHKGYYQVFIGSNPISETWLSYLYAIAVHYVTDRPAFKHH